jgi:effector-binding domain-containing protein
MTYQCELAEQSAQPTLSIRTRAAVQDLPQLFGRVYGALAQYLGELGEQPMGAPFAAYRNMDMQDLDVEAGFPVARQLAGKGEMQPGEIPGGKWAVTLHVGPYEQLRAAYDALGQWMKAHNYEPIGVAYEMYLNDPQAVPPQELQTKVVFPLK